MPSKLRSFFTQHSELSTVPPAAALGAFFYLYHLLFQGRTAMSQSCAFLGALFLGWAIAKKQVRPVVHILYFPLALYGLITNVSALAADRRIHYGASSIIWVKMLVFPTALILFCRFPRVWRTALRCHAAFASAFGGIGIVQFVLLDQRDLDHRISGTSSHVMTYSGLLLPLSMLFLILWIHDRGKWWLALPAALTTIALVLTFTRSAWLGWLTAVLVVIVASRPRWMIYVAPAMVWALVLMPLPIFERLVSTFDLRQSSNLDRLRMFEAGVEIIRDYPLLGVGPANVKEVYPIYRKHDAPRFRIPHLHNNVVQIWAERGVVALGAYVMLLLLFVRECARAWDGPGRRWAEAGLAVIVALTFGGLFEFNFGDTEVFYLMLDLMALVVAGMRGSVDYEVG